MYYNEEHKEMVEDRGYGYIGSYDGKEITIDGKNKNSNKYYYIRVRCPYCGNEYDVGTYIFKKGTNCANCCNKYENSFAYHIQVELKEPLNKYWDWEKNKLNPYLIYKQNNKKVWIKCTETNYHKSYETTFSHFYSGRRCPYCSHRGGKVHPKDSFAQWGIDTFGENFLTKYWSSKNTLNPWGLAPRSHKKIWILCQNKNYHNDNGGYEITCDNFYRGNGCSYCANQKVHPKDSFGYLHPNEAKYWSKDNNKSPYEVVIGSGKIFKFNCKSCGKEFEMQLRKIVTHNHSMKCRNCNSSKGEQKIKEWLINNNIKFVSQKTFKHLIGVRGGLLSYDFYLPNHNLLIEYQGEQHERYIKGLHQSKLNFERQKEHDKRKKRYAKDNNIELLEIWYYDYESVEEILKKYLTTI